MKKNEPKLIKVQIKIPEDRLNQLLAFYDEKDNSKAIIRHMNERHPIPGWVDIPIRRDPHNKQISDKEVIEIVLRYDAYQANRVEDAVDKIVDWLNEKSGRNITAFAVYAILNRKGNEVRNKHAKERAKRLGVGSD